MGGEQVSGGVYPDPIPSSPALSSYRGTLYHARASEECRIDTMGYPDTMIRRGMGMVCTPLRSTHVPLIPYIALKGVHGEVCMVTEEMSRVPIPDPTGVYPNTSGSEHLFTLLRCLMS
jgi:hypothetical protein